MARYSWQLELAKETARKYPVIYDTYYQLQEQAAALLRQVTNTNLLESYGKLKKIDEHCLLIQFYLREEQWLGRESLNTLILTGEACSHHVYERYPIPLRNDMYKNSLLYLFYYDNKKNWLLWSYSSEMLLSLTTRSVSIVERGCFTAYIAQLKQVAEATIRESNQANFGYVMSHLLGIDARYRYLIFLLSHNYLSITDVIDLVEAEYLEFHKHSVNDKLAFYEELSLTEWIL